MFKKLLCIFTLILLVACSRSTSSLISSDTGDNEDTEVSTTYTALWDSQGGDAQASNTVSNRLPNSLSLESFGAESDSNVYASPVIFNDGDGNQFVIALWVNSSTAKLVKYNYVSQALTKDTDFESLEFSADTTGFKAHQIALLTSGEAAYVYVTHNDGLSKIDALTGEEIASSNANGAQFSVLVYDSKVFATSGSEIVQYSSDLTLSGSVSLTNASAPTVGLPIVYSGSNLYVAQNSTIDQISFSGGVVSSVATPFTADAGETIANLAAYNDAGIVYALHYNITDEIIDGIGDYTWTTVSYGFFGTGTSNDGEDYFENYSELRRSKGANEDSPRVRSNRGDASYAALAVSSTTTYLPGSSTSYMYFVDTNNTIGSTDSRLTNFGLVSYTPQDAETDELTDASSSFFDSQLSETVEFSGLVVDYYFVSRFFVLDTDASRGLAVQNINESYFDTTINSTPVVDDSNYDTIFDDANDGDISGSLSNYNSRLQLGNSTTSSTTSFTDATIEIDTIAVGNQMAVVSASDGQLYLIK